MVLWARVTGLVLACSHLALLLALSLGRTQTDTPPMLAYLSRYQGMTHSYLLDIPRQQSLRLSRAPMPDDRNHHPVWSFDGRFLAYGEQVDHLARIAILDLHTSRIHLVADDRARNPAWLQTDRAQLVYTSPVTNALQTVDPLTGEITRLMDYRGESGMIWSIDGAALLVSRQSGNQEIYRLNPESGVMVNLTNHAGEDFQPAWSPDGEWIAFTSDRNRRNYEIYVVNRNGEQMRNITRSISEDWNPVWSPDGRSLAFVGSVYGNYQIYLTDIEHRATRNLTQTSNSEFAPVWSPAGEALAFVSMRDGRRQIYLMDADGKNQRPLVAGAAEYFMPVWRPMMPPAP